MLNRLPQEKESTSWLYSGCWVLIIFFTLPLLRFLHANGSKLMIGFLGICAVIVIALVTLRFFMFYTPPSNSIYAWMLLICLMLAGMSSQFKHAPPEEVFHIMQYYVLGFLCYRMLAHRIRDVSIYFAAIFFCAIVSIIDSTFQWASQREYWGINIVWWNVFVAALAQLTIAKGLQPRIISGLPNRRNMRRLGKLFAVAMILSGVSILSIPAREAWYAGQNPLELIKNGQNAMFDYSQSGLNYGFNEWQIWGSLMMIVIGFGIGYRNMAKKATVKKMAE